MRCIVMSSVVICKVAYQQQHQNAMHGRTACAMYEANQVVTCKHAIVAFTLVHWCMCSACI